jgi:hypothetical protein
MPNHIINFSTFNSWFIRINQKGIKYGILQIENVHNYFPSFSPKWPAEDLPNFAEDNNQPERNTKGHRIFGRAKFSLYGPQRIRHKLRDNGARQKSSPVLQRTHLN